MVLDEPLDIDEELVPSFDEGLQEQISNTARSSDVTSIIVKFEEIVVPKMIEMDWMSKVAKARSKPFYNNTDQNLNAHILPGIEILCDISEQSPKLDSLDLQDLISLWTIHDIHKIISEKDDEFSISINETREIVENLDMNKFNPRLDAEDYHSCAVALHNNEPAKIDDSTNRFTELRPALRLVDSIASISDPSEFVSQAERPVSKVFGSKNQRFVPAAHKVDLEDSITQQVVNKTLYEMILSHDYIPLDIRSNGVIYVRPAGSDDLTENVDEFLDQLTENTFSNLRSAYQSFRNRSLLGSNIENPQSGLNYNKPPRVYDISNLSKTCLNKEEIVQRIVQAAVEHQNKPYRLPSESKNQIDKLNNHLDLDIPKNTFIEGMAALVHTIYKDILPELVNSDSPNAYERTLEGGLLYLFDCSSETQHEIVNAIKNENIKSSPVEWPHKYIIARELHDIYTVKYSRTERQDELTQLLLERLTNFEDWDDFGLQSHSKIKDELYIRLATSVEINSHKLSDLPSINMIDKIEKRDKNGNCTICGTATTQSAISPSLLSHNDFDVLENTFSTETNGQLDTINLTDVVPKKHICVPCQIALTVRAQQFNNHGSESDLHVSIHPVNSVSVASYKRFDMILNILKRRVFTEKSSLYYNELGPDYKEYITDHLNQTQTIESFTNRKKAFHVAAKRDESSSSFELPDNSAESMIKAVSCVTVASLISGVRCCITKNPQLCINQDNYGDIVLLGSELSEFHDVIEARKDILDLPRRVKILDRVMRIGGSIGSINTCLKFYAEMDDSEILPGSRILSRVEHLIDQDNAYDIIKNSVSLDIISCENNLYGKDLLKNCSLLAVELSEYIKGDDVSKISTIVNRLFERLLSLNNITDEAVKDLVEELLSNNSYTSKLNDGNYTEISSRIITLYEKQNRQSGLRKNKNTIKSCIVSQVALRNLRNGDEYE